jgi:hypothetical protein
LLSIRDIGKRNDKERRKVPRTGVSNFSVSQMKRGLVIAPLPPLRRAIRW